jgi:protein tyrosine phosphatase (PTP) superfamily phosphohydrolase (DUF442 family)
MIRRAIPWLTVFVVAVTTFAGCCHKHTCAPPPPPCNACPPGPIAPPPAHFTPAPPPGVSAPATSEFKDSIFTQAPGNSLPPGPASPRPIVRLSAPEVPAASIPSPDAGAAGAKSPETPSAPSGPPPSVPPVREDRDTTPQLPVDIPQFAIARPKVASGQQPGLDGIAWLQSHGYRTVLHIHAPGEDDAAALRQFERHGLKYISLEVSPANLTPQVVEEFTRIVTDEAKAPLFVYDRDGSLNGSLWYLYYRLTDHLDDEHARTEAGKLGFKANADGPHRDMWLAVQKYLADRKR